MGYKLKISPYVFPGLKDLENFKSSKKIFISKEEVLKIICECMYVKKEDMVSKLKTTELVDARHFFVAYFRKKTNCPLKEIGDFLGGRDHTTMIHSLNSFYDRCSNYPEYKQRADSIFKTLDSKIF